MMGGLKNPDEQGTGLNISTFSTRKHEGGGYRVLSNKNRYENYLHCDNMFGIQLLTITKHLYVAVAI